jgi:FXSXX-COOH protein
MTEPPLVTKLPDITELSLDELLDSDDPVLEQLLDELVQDARNPSDGATIAAFNATL